MAEARAWKLNNPDAHSILQRAAKARRRALEKESIGHYTRQDIERLLVVQSFICAACFVDIRSKYHIDHMIPLARGGTNWPHNIQLLCQPCNQSKGPKTMTEWAAWKVEVTPLP